MIKDTEMHVGLPDNEIREFFSTSLRDNQTTEMECVSKYQKNLQSVYSRNIKKEDFGYLHNSINIAKINIAHHQDTLKYLNINLSLLTLMKEKGWKEHDVSDHIGRSGTHFLNFIGTDAEYSDLLEKLEK